MDAPIIAPIIKVSILTPYLRMLAYAGKQKSRRAAFYQIKLGAVNDLGFRTAQT